MFMTMSCQSYAHSNRVLPRILIKRLVPIIDSDWSIAVLYSW